MTWLQILYIVISILLALCGTIIPFVYKLYKACKARANAETATDKEKANADLLAMAKKFIEGAESTLNGIDKILKTQGDTAGAIKQDTTFIKLQAYALQHGYEFDAEYWKAQIDELVRFTKNVNVGK